MITSRPCLFVEKSFRKWFPRKYIYFFMFGSVMKNKLKNNFLYLAIPWKMSWKIVYSCFILFFNFIKRMGIKFDRLKIWRRMKLKKKIQFHKLFEIK
jgi:hypothetical protein